MEMLQAKKYPWKSSSKDVPASWKVWRVSLFYSSSLTSKVSVSLLKGWWFPPAILPTCPLVTPIPCCGPFSALYILQGAKYIFTFLRSSVIIKLWPNAKNTCWEFGGVKTSNIVRISWYLVFMSSLQMGDVVCAWLLLRACASQGESCYWVILRCDISHAHSSVHLKLLWGAVHPCVGSVCSPYPMAVPLLWCFGKDPVWAPLSQEKPRSEGCRWVWVGSRHFSPIHSNRTSEPSKIHSVQSFSAELCWWSWNPHPCDAQETPQRAGA